MENKPAKNERKNNMKRLLTATAALLLTCGLLTATAAELPAPVKTKLEAAQSDLAKAKAGTQEYARLAALCTAIAAYPGTFDEFVKIATDAYNKAGGDPAKLPDIISLAALWDTNEKYLADGYAYAKKNGVDLPHYALYAAKLGMSEEEEFEGLKKIFFKANDCDSWIFKQKMQRFATLLSAKPEAEAKALLKQINRIITPKLSTDKERWEPVVAMIRTMIETY